MNGSVRPSVHLSVHQSVKFTHGKELLIFTRIDDFQTITSIWIHQWLWNYAQSLICQRRGALCFFQVIRQISRSYGQTKINDLNPIWVRLLVWAQLSNPRDLSCFRTYHGYAMRKILPLCGKTVTCKSKGFLCLFGHNSRIHCFWLNNLNMFSQNITFRVINYLNLVEKIIRSWNVDEVSVPIISKDIR